MTILDRTIQNTPENELLIRGTRECPLVQDEFIDTVCQDDMIEIL